MPRTVLESIKVVEADGWVRVGQVGSHRQYEQPVKLGRVATSGKPSSDVHPKIEQGTLRQAGLIGGLQ